MQELVQQLEKEEQYFQCLVQLQEQMQTCLIKNQQTTLEQVVRQHEQCLQLMQQASKTRKKMLQPFGADLTTALETISDLRSKIQIKALQQKINAHIASLQQLRATNQVLAEQGLKYVQQTTEFYRSLTCSGAPAVYSPYGQMQIAAEPTKSMCEYDV
jgi:flagellar biosynthesis/type III secretory pathway chaperone